MHIASHGPGNALFGGQKELEEAVDEAIAETAEEQARKAFAPTDAADAQLKPQQTNVEQRVRENAS